MHAHFTAAPRRDLRERVVEKQADQTQHLHAPASRREPTAPPLGASAAPRTRHHKTASGSS
eukprot:836361-Pyramimonas_sp.AAC.1